MDWKEALAKLKKLDAEGAADLASVVESRIEALEADKFTVVGEKRNATTKATAYETALTAIAKALGIEGDLETVLTSAEGKVRELVSASSTAQSKLTELESRATTAEGKVKTFERSTKLGEIAAAAGANAAVLEQLLGDRFDDLKIEGEGDQRVVKLGDKALKEAIAADGRLKLFEAVLFPVTEKPQDKPAPRLPGGSPKGTETKDKNPVSATVEKMKFAVPGKK